MRLGAEIAFDHHVLDRRTTSRYTYMRPDASAAMHRSINQAGASSGRASAAGDLDRQGPRRPGTRRAGHRDAEISTASHHDEVSRRWRGPRRGGAEGDL